MPAAEILPTLSKGVSPPFFHDFVLDFSGSGGGGGGGGIFLMMIVGYLSKIFLVLLVLSPLSGFSTRFRGI